MPRLSPNELLRLATDIVRALGASDDDAHTVADHLVGAHLAGHDSHGVIRLLQYQRHVQEGKIVPDAQVTVLKEGSTTALLDANCAWGQVVAKRALDVALEKAREHGTAAVAVRNAYHIGRVGVYPQSAALEGFLAQLHCNGFGIARVAPWGGTEAKLATNPIAVAVPTKTDPIVVDITTSVVAEGKIRVAKNAGKSIPEGWVLDSSGEVTTDPARLYEGGTILPLGGREGYKGYGLSVLVDLFGGVLTGSSCGFMTENVGNGVFLQLTDPCAFLDRDEFLQGVEDYVAYLKASDTRQGAEILLPGEPEARTAKARADAIDLDDVTWEQLSGVAKSLDVALS
ncbi:MAG: Ldh family oxidoreductase [Planctomycetota bacterium]